MAKILPKKKRDESTRCLLDLVGEALIGKVFQNRYGQYQIVRIYEYNDRVRADIKYQGGSYQARNVAKWIPISDLRADKLFNQK